MDDLPFYKIAEQAEQLIEAGASIYFKFTCQHCGARQTFDEVNKLFTSGSCEECGEVTSLVENGCGYMVVFSR